MVRRGTAGIKGMRRKMPDVGLQYFMETVILSPKIVHLSWGRIEVEGHGAFKDVKVFPGGARSWDWSETGTDHEPGIQPADVEELLEHGARAVVLSRGMNGRLSTSPETLRLLERKGIAVRVLETEDAVEVYNELAGKEPVGALLHSTC